VYWTVSAGDGSYAQIDDDMIYHPGTGTRSAEFHYGGLTPGYYNVNARYSCAPANYLGFYVMKDDNSCFYFSHGKNGSGTIYFRITDGEAMQYCNGYWWYTVGSPILKDAWYLLEFRNINWTTRTYDIYLGGNPIKTGASMLPWPSGNGVASFSNTGTGSLWIDDICD
jgi:hypothetical protein